MPNIIMKAKKLRKHFAVRKRSLFAKGTNWIRAVDEISFSISLGKTFGLAGESGCGKTTTSRMILGLESPSGGSVTFKGKDIFNLTGREYYEYRRNVQAVFQDPTSSLNPRMTAGVIISAPLLAMDNLAKAQVHERVNKLLLQVGLKPEDAKRYPHEFSGGQKQRIALARALALNPSLIVLDEPVSALDVSIRAQVMNLLKDLQARLGLGYLLIAHDLATMRYMSHRIAIMYMGKIVELTNSEELFSNPLHPYTQALLSAALPSHPDIERNEIILRGEVQRSTNIGEGCKFYPRCFATMSQCFAAEPQLREIAGDHLVACHQY